MVPQSASEPEAPPRPRREKARGRLWLPAPLLRGKATPQLCARAARSGGSSSSASPPPRSAAAAAGLPLCWRTEQEAEEGGGAGASGGALPPLREMD